MQTRHFLLESFGKKVDKVLVGLKPAPGLGSEGLGEPSDAELFIRRGLLPSRDKIEVARRANKDLENGHSVPTVQPLPRNRRPRK